MSTHLQEKKASYKPKYEQKKVLKKFNFIFEEHQIDIKTQIPEVPVKLKPKPNEQSHKKKVQQMKARINSLKQERRLKKDQLKKGSKDFDDEISTLKSKIDLGEKCLIVLNHDLKAIAISITEIQQKIQKKIRLVKNLQRGPRQQKHQNKNYEQMTYEELQREQQRLSVKISTASLTKKEQTQINSLLGRITRLKKDAAHGEKPKDNSSQIQAAQDSLNRLRSVKQSLQSQQSETQHKIECIQQDVDDFRQEIVDIQSKKKDSQSDNLYKQTQDLKNKIYSLRDEVAKVEKEFQTKKYEYDYEQVKIQWIEWASKIKKKKQQQWQADRQQKRRQKLRQKNKQKSGQAAGGNQNDKGDGQKKYQKKKINKHQKQIDACSFLISYCEGLIHKEQQEKKNDDNENKPNIEDALKKGEWAKVKDVQIIKSKKTNVDQQQNKTDKLKKKKTQKNKQSQTAEVAKPANFNHQIFIQQQFDSVKVVPPSKPEQVEGITKELNEKLEYFLENPDGGFEQQRGKFEQKQQKGQKYTAQKFAKAKNNPRQKKAINTQDFPHLN